MEQAHEAQNGTKSVSEYGFFTKTLDAVHFQEACLSNNISNNSKLVDNYITECESKRIYIQLLRPFKQSRTENEILASMVQGRMCWLVRRRSFLFLQHMMCDPFRLLKDQLIIIRGIAEGRGGLP